MTTTRQPEKYKISFCTTCMDRLHHLKETLPVNISDNIDYDNVEFVILNYNSSDEIDRWMSCEMIEQIRCHRVRYIKTLEPLYFKMSHAKNMVTKFATGDIVCNIDADNYTGKDFAEYVNLHFNSDKNSFLTGGKIGHWDLMGRVCSWKSDFLKLRGYDERIQDYGYEDTDFYYRLSNSLERKEIKIENPQYLKSIQHDTAERMRNGRYNSEISFGIALKTVVATKAYIFKENGQYEFIVVRPSRSSITFEKIAIDKKETRYGNWSLKDCAIELRNNGSASFIYTNDNGETYLGEEGTYQRLPKEDVCFYYSLLKGQMVFKENIETKSQVNEGGFGEGIVFEPL